METVSVIAVLISGHGAPDDTVMTQAGNGLRRLGFEVYPGGPMALTVNAQPEQLANVFGLQLEVGADGQIKSIGNPAVIPPDLAPFVDRIEIPTRHETFP